MSVIGKEKKPTYQELWKDPEGAKYRSEVFNRQKANGMLPLTDNPTFDEIKEAIKLYSPGSVLEIGCGWGRILEHLKDEPYDLWGCDISQDMIDHASKDLKVFYMDITAPDLNGHSRWDVTFSRGVLHYFLEKEELIRRAIRNIEMFTLTRCIVWELPEVCEAINRLKSADLFDLKPIEHKDE